MKLQHISKTNGNRASKGCNHVLASVKLEFSEVLLMRPMVQSRSRFFGVFSKIDPSGSLNTMFLNFILNFKEIFWTPQRLQIFEQTTLLFTTPSSILYGTLSWISLVCFALCLLRSQSYLTLGILFRSLQNAPHYGAYHFLPSFGAYGRNVTI